MPFDQTRLSAARLRAAESQPFLALALYALTAIDDPRRGTFAVDERLRLYVDGSALERWTIEEAAGVLLHEVGHVIRDHAGRARVVGVTPESASRWNVAADAELNDDLVSDGIALPTGAVTPSSLGLAPGRVAEYYFHSLSSAPDTPDCGAGCHGQGGEDRTTEVAETVGLTGPELFILRRRVAHEIQKSERQRAGTELGGWSRWAEAVLEPQLDWRTTLDGLVRGAVASVAGRTDYSYQRPSRRRVDGVILPAMRRPLPVVAIIVDVSASISDDDLAHAWSEVHGCFRAIGLRRELLRVYATDVSTARVSGIGRKSISLSGGGGTDLRHGISTALRDRPRPGVIVAITDGWTPWPARPTPVPLVVALLDSAFAGSQGESPEVPSWARCVEIRTGAADE